MEKSARDLAEVILARKSVRHFTGEKADEASLISLLRAGMAAPSANDIRPWAFIMVTEPALLEELADGLPFAKMLPAAGSAIVVCARQDKIARGTHPGMWVQDCSAVTENILLAAEAMGLGAVWTACHPHEARSAHVAKVLQIPPEIIVFNVIAVGHPTGEDLPRDKYDPVLIHREKW
jgi:nitroreductase